MIHARGVYQKTWTGTAARNLVRQLPLIAPSLPGIADYHPATVNVRFGPMLIVAGSDVRTPPLAWKPSSEGGGEDGEAGEVFDFVRVRLAFGDPAGRSYAGLLYVGHWSLHRLDPHKHEFLVETFVDGLTDGMTVTMTCERQAVDLPYSKTDTAGDAARTIVIF